MVGAANFAAGFFETCLFPQDPSRRRCRGRVNGRCWNLVNDVGSFLNHEGFQKTKPWGKDVNSGGVTNSEDVDSIFSQNSLELGEKVGGGRWRGGAEIVDISVFNFFSGVQPALRNDVGRCISRGGRAISIRDHTLAFLEGKVMMDKVWGVRTWRVFICE